MRNFFKEFLVTLAFSSSAAFAAPVTVDIDTFNTDPMSASDLLPNGTPVVLSSTIRTLSNNLLTGISPFGNTVDVTGDGPGGYLDITNGNGEDSEVRITWNLRNGLIPAGATNVTFFFDVLRSDGNPSSVEFFLNGSNVSSNVIAANTRNRTLSFGLSGANLAAANGGTLQLRINGDEGWDFSADWLRVSYEPAAVPLPGTLALLGFGMLVSLRRKNK